MKNKMSLNLWLLISVATVSLFSVSCNSDDIADENLYTFTDKMLGQYIEADSSLSEFYSLITKTKVLGLLNSYGEYTCFVPDNEAMREFYKSKGKQSLDDFSDDSLKIIIYDHLINGSAISQINFNAGRLPVPSMSNRFITISYSNNQTYINKTSLLVEKDIELHNGILHKIDRVLDPVRAGIVEVLAQEEEFSIFYAALIETGLADSLLLTKDESYSLTESRAVELEDAVMTTIASDRYAPRTREYGYTVLIESNGTLKNNGIENLDDLKKYAASVYDQIYPADTGIDNPKNRANSLNRFIAYHLINKELSYTRFLSDYDTGHMFKTVDMYEYLAPMSPNTLIEIKNERTSGKTNLFNYIKDTGKSIQIVMSNYDNDASNGVYHEIDNMLVFSREVEGMISSKRLRIDVASLFPELTNNNMRGRPSDNGNLYRYALPAGYLKNLQSNEQTVICYTAPNDKLMNYEGDEIFIATKEGQLYDINIETLPIPAGTYEVRFSYQANGRRGVAQFYLDGTPSGVPVNLNTSTSDPAIGYIAPGSDAADPFGYDNDKMMRNRGYMKGPGSYKAINSSWYPGESARFNAGNVRKILGTFEFSDMKSHYLSAKGLSGGQFQIDFIEFIPTSAIESEDIY